MKILTGQFRGKTIRFKSNPYLRPTADKARKAIFDMLQGAMQGKRVLDLFGGTGALGLEALSNGALFAVFVENNKNQAAVIRENLKMLGVEKSAQVLAQDALESLSSLYQKGEVYDFIFLDPPYEGGLGFKAMEALARLPVWNSGGLIFYECRDKEPDWERIGELKLFRSKTYGDTKILVYSAAPFRQKARRIRCDL